MFITKAAIMFSNGEILEGRDYGYIGRIARKLGFSGERIEGFLTSSGEFVLPHEAAAIAMNSGQVKEEIITLTPDHLWSSRGVE